jgi:uncharacterized protein (TIGR03435 family)
MTLNPAAWVASVATAMTLSVALTAAQGDISFEVASIKRNLSGDPRIGLDISRGQLRATNAPMLMVMRQAFEVMDSQIIDAPGWVSEDRYDILAKAPEGLMTAAAMRPLMRTLLAERFKLVIRRENREMPVYALVRFRSDGTFGPTFRPNALDCAAGARPAPAGDASKPPGPDDWLECSVSIGPGALNLGGYRMAEVTRILSSLVSRPVIDETEVTTPVQLRLKYVPDSGVSPDPVDAVSDDRPTLFTALQEQTGLKLEPRRSPVEVLVIERIERPTEN